MCKQLLLFLIIFSQVEAILTYQSDPYATHQPILIELVNQTKGPIIEFGCGTGSTDILHEICKKEGRLLISLDDNESWLSQFAVKYSKDSDWHWFYFVPGKKNELDPTHWIRFLDNFSEIEGIFFDICFIDQSPWLGRYETLKRFKDRSRYVIVHDCNYFPEQKIFGKVVKALDRIKKIEGVFDFSDIFTSFQVYYPPRPWPGNTGPPTLVGSEYEKRFPEIDYTESN